MSQNMLKKMNRAQLLELLLSQIKETERLNKLLKAKEAELADRNLRVEKAGDLATAVLAVNGVIEAAEKAAQQYLDNIRLMEEQTRIKCEKLIADATEEASRIRKTAQNAVVEVNTLIEEIHEILHDNVD